MQIRRVLTILTICITALLFTVSANAQKPTQSPGKTPDKQKQWNCPYYQEGAPANEGWRCPMCGGNGKRPHQGYHGGWYTRTPPQEEGMMRYKQPLTEQQAEAAVEAWLRQMNNPNLEIGEITENDDYYEAQIVTKDDSLVDRVQVHKQTGWIRSAYSAPPEEQEENGNR